jgi:hypothetical protein
VATVAPSLTASRTIDPQLLGAPDDRADELVGDVAVHDEARGRRAALARGAECAEERAVGGEIEVGVREHDHRVLPAELQADEPRAGRRGCRGHGPTGRHRPGEADRPHARMDHERLPGLAVAVHDVHEAVGHACLAQRAGELLRARRRVLGRLEHDAVARE